MTCCVSVQVSESFGRRHRDPSGMKSLKISCSLQSLEARWVLCASVSLLAIWKRCYLSNFHGWKMFFYTKLCYCKLGLMSRRNSMAWIAICTVKQWDTLIPSTMKGFLCTEVHHLLKDSTSQESADTLNYRKFTNTIWKTLSLNWWEQWTYSYRHSSELYFYPFKGFFFIFRKF